MKKPTTKKTGDVASDYAKAGKRMAMQPKMGESAKKNLTVGRASTTTKNGIYVPKPTAAAKKAAAPVKKSNWKAPSSKGTGMGKAMKTGSKSGGMKCFKK